MLWHMLADAVVGVHFLFILFVVLGGLTVLWRRWMAWVHLPAFLWGAGIEFFGWPCPLTFLEVWLRRRAGGAGYAGGFIQRYIAPLVYPGPLTRETQIALGVLLVVWNVALYALAVRRFRRRGGAA
jgi:hypothetical protein